MEDIKDIKEMEHKKIEDNISCLLLVEGKDECYFFESYIKYLSENNYLTKEKIQILDVGGKDKFKSNFKVLHGDVDGNFRNITRIGFVRDADENSDGAFKSIQNILKEYSEIPCPLSREENINETNALHTGIFIMPDNSSKGALENLVLETVKDKKEYKCVENFIDCIPKYKTSNKNKIAKASILAYLASQKNVVNSLGVGAQKGYWDFEHVSLTQLRDFIIKLFS